MSRLPSHPFPPNRPRRALPDSALISACLKGDQSAWETLIDRYAGLIYSVCLRMGLTVTDAEDVVQDVSVILLDRLAQVRDHDRLSSWLISTTRREVWRFQRRKGAKLATELGEGEWAMEVEDAITAPAGASPEAAVIALEEEQMVRMGMDSLPERCRRLLTLLYGTDEPPGYTEIASDLDMPVGSIGPTRARCLQNLRKLLAQLGY